MGLENAGYGGAGSAEHYGSGAQQGQQQQQRGALARAAAQKREQEADAEVATRFAQIQSMICDCTKLTASGVPALPLDLCAVLWAGTSYPHEPLCQWP